MSISMEKGAIGSLCHSYSNKIEVLQESQEEHVGEAAPVPAQEVGASTPIYS